MFDEFELTVLLPLTIDVWLLAPDGIGTVELPEGTTVEFPGAAGVTDAAGACVELAGRVPLLPPAGAAGVWAAIFYILNIHKLL